MATVKVVAGEGQPPPDPMPAEIEGENDEHSRQCHPPARPQWSNVASATQIRWFRAVWIVSGLAIVASLLLLIGAVTRNPLASETGRPAAVSGLIVGCFGALIVIVGMLVRFGVVTSNPRSRNDDH
ncbi:hypothetical protein [Saccharopolyspora shandongensis]|uniref:hypothetical protein n=1 Tax=Saccharopolyspora shandongensis TaxID=418495 RepID=UPI00340311DF